MDNEPKPGLPLSDLEDALLLLQIFRILGRLYEVNPPLMRDALKECRTFLKEANNRAPISRGYAQIATDEMVKGVCVLTECDKELARVCCAAAILPSKLQNVLDVCRANWNAHLEMKKRRLEDAKRMGAT